MQTKFPSSVTALGTVSNGDIMVPNFSEEDQKVDFNSYVRLTVTAVKPEEDKATAGRTFQNDISVTQCKEDTIIA